MAGKFSTSAPTGARASCLWVKVKTLTATNIPRKRGTTLSLKPPPPSRSFQVWNFHGPTSRGVFRPLAGALRDFAHQGLNPLAIDVPLNFFNGLSL